jgi:hypothetical protein
MISLARQKHPGYDFQVLDALEEIRTFPQIISLYGGYFSVQQIHQFVTKNLLPGGSLFFHIPSVNRNATFVKKTEDELGIPMETISTQKISWLKSQNYSHLSFLKTNAFNRWKTKFPYPLYKLSVLLDQFLPFPIEQFTWVMVHIKN